MKKKLREYIYKRNIKHCGIRTIIYKAIEEFKECIFEFESERIAVDKLTEELADALNMIEQLKLIYNIKQEKLEDIMLQKMERQAKRIGISLEDFRKWKQD